MDGIQKKMIYVSVITMILRLFQECLFSFPDLLGIIFFLFPFTDFLGIGIFSLVHSIHRFPVRKFRIQDRLPGFCSFMFLYLNCG